MGIRVLGPLTIDGSGHVGRRDRVVLGALATRPGHPVSADQLADALWGEVAPASSTKILQGCVVRLRKLLGPGAIETSPRGYVLRLPADEIDALRFERDVARARALLTLGESDRAAYLLGEALSLWNGVPYDDLGEWEPALAESGRLDELRLEAEELRVDAHLRAGRHREVIAEAQVLVRAAPLRERRWTLLARAQYQSGQQAEALRTIHQLRTVLSGQLGIDPDPAVLALERSILRQDPSLRVPDAPAAAGASCPWQGLKPYDVDDADRFFGRDRDVAACLATLERTSLLALVGPSGSGKSSILRAGVAAALRARGRRTRTVTPGAHPLQALSALTDAHPGTALLVDQFEELFSLCDDPGEQQEFLRVLTEEASTRTVALALRADRLADVAAHPAFSRLLERGLYLVGGLGEDGLRAAVEEPARQAGLVVEPGLVDLLVSEVREDPGALPLLSHALLETWLRREGNTLTVDGYRASGGIRGAVAQSAERLYAGIAPEHRHVLRDLMLRLVSPGPLGEPVRARVPRRLVSTDREYDLLIELLVTARLLTIDDGALEISHEALARAWPRLRGWLEDDLEGQRILHHLSTAADAWDGLQRPDSELYRGVRLARVLDWSADANPLLTRTERDFLDASRRVADAEEQSAAERARAQSLLIRRLRIVLGGAAVLLVLALAAGGLAAVQSERAGRNAAAARGSETRAVAREAGANALVTEDVAESMLLAVAGVRLDETQETRTNLLAAIGRRPELFESTPIEDGALPLYLDASPDGRHLAVLSETQLLRLYDASTGELVAQRQLGPALAKFGFALGRFVAFSPDSRTVAVAQTPRRTAPVALLRVPTLDRVATLGGLPTRGWQAADLDFSADGTHLAAGLQHYGRVDHDSVQVAARALVWDLADPATPRRIPLPDGDGGSVALDARGRTLYTADPLTRHVLTTPARTTELTPDGSHDFWGLHLVRDDQQLLTLDDSRARLLDASTGRVLVTYRQDDFINAVRVSPDGRSFLGVAWESRRVAVWRLSNPDDTPVREIELDRGNPGTVTYSADGTYVQATGEGGTALRRWDLTGRRQYVETVPRGGNVSASFGIVGPGGARSVFLWGGWDFVEHDTGEITTIPYLGGYRHTYGAFHPDGNHFATAAGPDVRVWDIRTGEPTGQRARFPSGQIAELDYTENGERLAVAELRGIVTMLDGTSLGRIGTPVDVREPLSWVVARPDGRTAVVLTGGVESTGTFQLPTTGWALVDLEEGSVLRRGRLQMTHGFWLAVSPDGRWAVVGGGEDADATGNSGAAGMLEMIDLTTGRPVGPPRSWPGTARSQVSFSPDGSRLLTTSPNGAVAVWDVGTLDPVSTLVVPGAATLSGAFLPDGGSARLQDWSSGVAYTWRLDTDHAVDFACRVAGRNFTVDEWAEHFGERPYVKLCDL